MVLMQRGWEIAQAKSNRNLFVLDLAIPNKIIQTTLLEKLSKNLLQIKTCNEQ